ncbi:MAG: PIN domain-containing protein [Pseudomonadota bacterium]
MRVLLDANVLFPTIVRELLLGAAAEGLLTPLYSERILEEWRRAVGRRMPENDAIVTSEITAVRVLWPAGEIALPEGLEETLSLPDPDDRHVLAAAIAGEAEALITFNLRDFPGRVLNRHGLLVRSPDSLLTELATEPESPMPEIAEAVRARAEAAFGAPQKLRPLFKRAHLPRLGKTLET